MLWGMMGSATLSPATMSREEPRRLLQACGLTPGRSGSGTPLVPGASGPVADLCAADGPSGGDT